MVQEQGGSTTGANSVPQSEIWTDRELRLQHERFVAALEARLDIEAGLADALTHLEHREFVSKISSQIDIEAGLEAALKTRPETRKADSPRDVRSPLGAGGRSARGSSWSEGWWERIAAVLLAMRGRQLDRSWTRQAGAGLDASTYRRPQTLPAIFRVLPIVLFGGKPSWKGISLLVCLWCERIARKLESRPGREKRGWERGSALVRRKYKGGYWRPRSVEAQLYDIIDQLAVLRFIRRFSLVRHSVGVGTIDQMIVLMQGLSRGLEKRTITLEYATQNIDKALELFEAQRSPFKKLGIESSPLVKASELVFPLFGIALGISSSFVSGSAAMMFILLPLMVGFLAVAGMMFIRNRIHRRMVSNFESLRRSVRYLFDPSEEHV